MKTLLITLGVLACLAVHVSAQTLAAYQAVVTSQSPTTYFKFDGDLVDSVGGTLTLTVNGTTGAFAPDSFRNQATARIFVSTGDALLSPTDFIPGGGTADTNAAGVGSITMLFTQLGQLPSGQKFILSQGTNTTAHNAFELYIDNPTGNNGVKLRVGNITTEILASNDVVFAAWYYFAMTYNETNDSGEVTWYLGRLGDTLNSGTIDIANDAVVGENGTVYIGNRATLANAFQFNQNSVSSSGSDGRIDELAVWNRELTGAEITNQWNKLLHPNPKPRATYQSIIYGQSPKFYFTLDNNATNSGTGGALTLNNTGTTSYFGRDYFGNSDGSQHFVFQLDSQMISSNLLNGGGPFTGSPGTGKGSISCLFQQLNYTNNSGQRFVFSTDGSTTTTNGFGLLMENYTSTSGGLGAMKVRFGNASRVIQPPEDFIYSGWYYFAMTYDETVSSNQVTWYLGPVGGTLTNGIFDYPTGSRAGDGTAFYIGTGGSSHNSGWSRPGDGAVDEFAIWHRLLTPTEVATQFAAIENVPSPALPTLNVARSGSNAVLSWSTNSDAAFFLESTLILPPTNGWTFVGSPSISGSSYVVTDAVAGVKSKFYRLHKP